MYLLDTNVGIYFMKNTYPRLTQRLLSHDPSELLIPSLTVLELEYGAEKSNWGDRTRLKMALFLTPFTILPFETSDALSDKNRWPISVSRKKKLAISEFGSSWSRKAGG